MVVQQWNPDDWESFSQFLLHTRHGALNVHKVPATHSGDLGIDFYCTTEPVIYQCYAVNEPVDVVTRAQRQKRKITEDLNKMLNGATHVATLFHGRPVEKWVLLVPLHDSKDVNLHCAQKTTDIRARSHGFLDQNFEVCVQDRSAFPKCIQNAAMSTITNISLRVKDPTDEDVEDWQHESPDLLANANRKLSKLVDRSALADSVSEAIRCFLRGQALLEALRSGSPDIHENVIGTIARRVRRLRLAGPNGGPNADGIMHSELDALTGAIGEAAPTLSRGNADDIVLGTVSEWVMRCPLDFPR